MQYQAKKEVANERTPVFAELHAIVVDSSHESCTLTSRLLEQIGMKPLSSTSLELGIEQFSKMHTGVEPSVAIIDYQTILNSSRNLTDFLELIYKSEIRKVLITANASQIRELSRYKEAENLTCC